MKSYESSKQLQGICWSCFHTFNAYVHICFNYRFDLVLVGLEALGT